MRDVEFGFLILFIVVVMIVAFLVALPMLRDAFRGVTDKRQSKKEIEAQQQLAILAPAALRGDALLPIVIDQGKKLQTADILFDKLIRSDIDVFMPTEMSEQIRSWQSRYQQEK